MLEIDDNNSIAECMGIEISGTEYQKKLYEKEGFDYR